MHVLGGSTTVLRGSTHPFSRRRMFCAGRRMFCAARRQFCAARRIHFPGDACSPRADKCPDRTDASCFSHVDATDSPAQSICLQTNVFCWWRRLVCGCASGFLQRTSQGISSTPAGVLSTVVFVKADTRSSYAESTQRVVERIATNLDSAVELEQLAAGAGLSPFHFHRVFRGMVGETPLELMRRLRLERAAWQLGHSETAVIEIAFDAGYETHEAFTRAFRASYNTSPTGFRRRRIKRIELAATCGVHFDPGGRVPPFVPRDSGGRTMQVDIKQKPEMRVAGVRHVGPYNQIVDAFATLDRIVRPSGLLNANTQLIAIYHDDPESTPKDRLRSDAAITVPPDAKLPSELKEQRVPAGRYACAVHTGPYEQLGDAWARFMGEWLPASGQRLADGVSYEVYLNTPMTEPDKTKLRTELCVPLASQ